MANSLGKVLNNLSSTPNVKYTAPRLSNNGFGDIKELAAAN